MIILISGSNGFIGQHLVAHFTKRGDTVYQLPRELLPKPAKLRDYLHKIKPNVILHLAAYGNHASQQDNSKAFIGNIFSTWSLLEASKDIPYKAFLNFGSSSEYGKKSSPMNELDLPETNTMYGCTKLASSYLCRAFAKKYDKPIVNLRLFSVFGEGEADHRFIPTVIHNLLYSEQLTLDGEATHDWIYISDVILAVSIIIRNADILSGQVVNIGTGVSHSNFDVVAALEVMSKKRVKIKETKNMRVDNSEMWQADISKIKTFGWFPKTSFYIGLARTYSYYRNKYYGN